MLRIALIYLYTNLFSLLVICFWLIAMSTPVRGDDSQPLYIELIERSIPDEKEQTQYQLQWRLPASTKINNAPVITLPTQCRPGDEVVNSPPSTVQRRFYQCDSSLAGSYIEIAYPRYNPSMSSIIKYHSLSGEQHTRLLSPAETRWQIPRAEIKSRIVKDYAAIGIQHIWAGTDHLLFLLCLLWIAGSPRRVLITITGFTVAHSVTLTLSALQLVRLPVPPIEAVIALSIVFLATEIVKNNPQTLTWRYPIAVSSSFGLLHGFGFAAALAEIGLPQTELFTGLLFFNIGVEIGQIIFVGGALLLFYLVKQYIVPCNSTRRLTEPARIVCSYSIGSLAVFWLVERTASFLHSEALLF